MLYGRQISFAEATQIKIEHNGYARHSWNQDNEFDSLYRGGTVPYPELVEGESPLLFMKIVNRRGLFLVSEYLAIINYPRT